jgi:predicted SAM-dependent methyltransferase
MTIKWLQSRSKAPAKLQGFIDLVDCERVAGWAATYGGVAPQLTIHVNGRSVDSIVPNIERADLKPLFPNNIRLGFSYRFATPLTEDAQIAVTDEDGHHLSHSPYPFKVPQTEWIANQKRPALAAHYLKGIGIEIGALHEPLTVPTHVHVKYVDRMSRADLYKHYPELGSYNLIEPDIICNGEALGEIGDASIDFVIANHFIEHAEDPIATLETFLRVLRPDGIIFMAVPDKHWSFDKDREITDFSHLQRDHEAGPQTSRHQHFVEWARLVEKCPEENLAKRVQDLEAVDYSIHFHVWDALSFIGFVSQVASRFRLPLQLCAVIADRDELVVILRKRA